MTTEVKKVVGLLDRHDGVQEFMLKHRIVAVKHNEREWGSYELALAHGEHPTVAFASTHVWGSAIPVHLAIQSVLVHFHKEPPNTGKFSEWLGAERVLELQQILAV